MEDEERLTVASDFGNLLRRHRLAAGLSQEELAERARISTHGVSALERGYRRTPQRETLALLSAALVLTGEQRRECEMAARAVATRRLSTDSATPGSSRDLVTSNLPHALTSFVGRDHDVAEVKELLERYRLLTLVGAGGIGKTRLAVQVGLELIDRYPDGVWFVDFAPIGDSELVASVVAQALGMRQAHGRSIEESIPLWLKRRKLLLILDNCEHVLGAAAGLVVAILRTAPDVCVLLTSRQPLGIGGEGVHRVPLLAVPADAIDLKAQEALGYSAVRLFADRATAADTRFMLTDHNAAIVAEICCRLDGIALAIELAAARVTVLSLPNLARQLNGRFEILSGGSRTALPRQKTMTALIDWSHDLLEPQEQVLFARLGVFAGGFGLDAASVVCGEGLGEIEIFDLLSSLTDKSLVVAHTSGETERYRLLESTTAYARKKLGAGGERERLTQRHAEYFCDRAAAADERFGSCSTVVWTAGVELELDNYRAALEWALTRENNIALGGAIAGALQRLWYNAGLSVEGRYWIELALSRVREAEQPAIAARLQLTLSGFLDGKVSYEAAQRAIQLYESIGDLAGAARARRQRGWVFFQMGKLEEAREASAQALSASLACGDAWNVTICQNLSAVVESELGDFVTGRTLFEQALRGKKALGEELEIAETLSDMAELEFAAGNPDHALGLVNEALEIDLRGKNAGNIAYRHINGAAYRIALNDLEGARESARDGLRFSLQVQAKQQSVVACQRLALLAALGGDPRRGAQLLGYEDAQYELLGIRRSSTERWGHDKLVAALREKLSEDEIAKLAAEGAAWSEDQAVEEALKA